MAAYSMDISSRRLSSLDLTEALARLANLLDGEEDGAGASRASPPRALVLAAAGNDLTRFVLPVAVPRASAPRGGAPDDEDGRYGDGDDDGSYDAPSSAPNRGDHGPSANEAYGADAEPMMDMMLMGWNDEEPPDARARNGPGQSRAAWREAPVVSAQGTRVSRRPQQLQRYAGPAASALSAVVYQEAAGVPIEDRIIELDLSRNRLGPRLDMTPPSFSRLHRLRDLDLSSNGLSSLIGLAQCTSLTALVLCDNDLRDADGLAPLKLLKRLDLRSNNIAAAAALRVLSLNERLVELDLRGNPLCCVGAAAADGKTLAAARVMLRSMLPRLARLGVGVDAGAEPKAVEAVEAPQPITARPVAAPKGPAPPGGRHAPRAVDYDRADHDRAAPPHATPAPAAAGPADDLTHFAPSAAGQDTYANKHLRRNAVRHTAVARTTRADYGTAILRSTRAAIAALEFAGDGSATERRREAARQATHEHHRASLREARSLQAAAHVSKPAAAQGTSKDRGSPGTERGSPGKEHDSPSTERGSPGAHRGPPGAQRLPPGAQRPPPGTQRGPEAPVSARAPEPRRYRPVPASPPSAEVMLRVQAAAGRSPSGRSAAGRGSTFADRDCEVEDERIREAWNELPWRAPPNPLPRWMLEREIGQRDATHVLRESAHRKAARATKSRA
ncbi:hypothetical protein M885DRAFT_617922 [Pelagophyceae sp. CCMP2097]|nr:hypothetical protein M885DRAFT_617922 [Pelagophyceae sp. CCMP2097]